MRHRRWGERKLSDEVIREIRALVQVMPRCEKTDLEVASRFHIGAGLVRKIALGWVTPRGTDRPLTGFHNRE